MTNITIIGAGAAGLWTAMLLSRHKCQITLLDMGKAPGRKIRISGGSKCNFTNVKVSADNYVSGTKDFVRSALASYSNEDFLDFVSRNGLEFTLKEQAKFFCAHDAKDLINLLLEQIEQNQLWYQSQVDFVWKQQVVKITKAATGYCLHTASREVFLADYVIVATGGLAMPRLQVSDISALDLFNHAPTSPGLVPLAYTADTSFFKALSGVSLPVTLTLGKQSFNHQLLFTHTSISGPAVLQISNYREQPSAQSPQATLANQFYAANQELKINWLPHYQLNQVLTDMRSGGFFTRQLPFDAHWPENAEQYAEPSSELITCAPTRLVKNLLSLLLPSNFVNLLSNLTPDSKASAYIASSIAPILEKQIAQLSKQDMQLLCDFVHNYSWTINKDLGYDKAEIMRGGIATADFNSSTMESKQHPGLYAIGECLDVQGWLGGYNFQWCWSSGYKCYQALAKTLGWEAWKP